MSAVVLWIPFIKILIVVTGYFYLTNCNVVLLVSTDPMFYTIYTLLLCIAMFSLIEIHIIRLYWL